MTRFPDLDPGLPWFVAVPDNAVGAGLVASLRERMPGLRRVDHASGRPWLAGRWADGEAVVARIGDRRLAVLGEHRIEVDELIRLAGPRSDAAGMCAALADRPGSFHVIAADARSVELHGTLSGFRRVFHGRAGDLVVAADRADVVAAVLGTDVDADRLAARLLSPVAPWPLLWQPVWQGVEALAPADRLSITHGGRVRSVRRWEPPPPVLGRAEAAERLHAALDDAVRARTRPGTTIAGDLSGLDSTSLCWLAARDSALLGLTCVSTDPLDDDLHWARQTAGLLPGMRHEVLDADAKPAVYEGVLSPVDHLDEPSTVVMHRGHFVALSERAAAGGARTRLTGFGGDELFCAEPSLQAALLRSDPLVALRHLRLLRARLRWRRRDVLRAVLDRRDYGTWLAGAGRGLGTTPRFGATTPVFGWGVEPHVAPWVTAEATERLRTGLIAAAGDATALAGDGGTHFRLLAVHAGAAMVRQLDQISRRAALPAAAPYFDDQVLRAALAVRLAEVTDPRAYKPLLIDAMRRVVPEHLLSRRTKAETTIAEARDAAAHRAELMTLADDSLLARRGLIDPDRLRAAVRSPDDRTWYDLEPTLAGETWLRTLEGANHDVDAA